MKSLIKHIGLILRSPSFWIWAFPLLLIVPNIGLFITEQYSFPAKCANILLPFGVYLLLMGISSRTGRAILFFPLCVLCAFQIVLFFLFGESIIAIDMFMNVMTTNASEVAELLGNLLGAIVLVVILYLPPLCFAVVMTVRRIRAPRPVLRRARIAGTACLLLGLILVFIAEIMSSRFSVMRQIFPCNVCGNIVTAIIRDKESKNYFNTSQSFSYNASATHPDSIPEIYVFVVGETARAADWQLFGYGRPTNPRLSQRRNLTAFSRALTEINTTHKSVPMLMSSLSSENFGDSVAHVRSVFKAFSEAGFRTLFISNQNRNGSYIDFYGEEADSALFLEAVGGRKPDMDVIAPLAQAVDSDRGNKLFVILHTYGSHFEYRHRYPASMAFFTPESDSKAERSNRPQLINAYDNTIRYTDALLDSIISVIDRPGVRSALVYTSDHGEDIFDDDRSRFLHASPVPTYWQLHVPLIIWTSDGYATQWPRKARALAANASRDVSTSLSVFHTLVDLAGISTPFFRPESSLASRRYTPAPRRYLNDYNESVPFAHAGFHPEDFTQFSLREISTR